MQVPAESVREWSPAFEPLTAAESLQIVPVADLFESPRNPRKHFDPARLAELSQSIKDRGILVPLIALPTGELVAGHRRFRGARMAGLQFVPVIVRDLTPEQALEVMAVDNLQREDVHPLEEGLGYRDLLQLGTYDVPAIAAKVGKSESYVYSRLKLTDLCDQAQEAFLDGRITIGHARLIAPMDPAKQAEALAACFEEIRWGAKKGTARLVSLDELRDWIRDSGSRDLDNAPFSLDDEELTAAGSCAKCPKSSGANLGLFEDGETVCYDPKCYDAKVEAHVTARAAEGLVAIDTSWAGKNAPEGVIVRDEYQLISYVTDDEPEKPEEPAPGDADKCRECGMTRWQIEQDGDTLTDGVCSVCGEDIAELRDAEKPCAFAERAVVASGGEHDKGKEAWICRSPKCPEHGKRMQERAAGGSSDAARKKEREAEEAKRKLHLAVRKQALQHVLAEDWSEAIGDLYLRSWLVDHFLDQLNNLERLKQIAKEREIDLPAKSDWESIKKVIREWYNDAHVSIQNRFVVELLLYPYLEIHEWQTKPDLIAAAANACVVDMRKIEAELKKADKPAAKKAAAIDPLVYKHKLAQLEVTVAPSGRAGYSAELGSSGHSNPPEHFLSVRDAFASARQWFANGGNGGSISKAALKHAPVVVAWIDERLAELAAAKKAPAKKAAKKKGGR
jgi:ParB/RepB/Spo0J family partition protein